MMQYFPDHEIIQNVTTKFKISLPRNVEFIRLQKRYLVEAAKYPHFTLLGQSLGSIRLAFEALGQFVPDVFLDTTGYAFSAPVFHVFGDCKTACYVHYPTISTDMLGRVRERRGTYNNPSLISNSVILTMLKLAYYRIFAYLYSIVGNQFQVVMVNSSWTQGHMNQLWGCEARIVYPPCNTEDLKRLPLTRSSAVKTIVSIGQFRPEKDHGMQISAFAKFLREIPDSSNYRLVLIGGCRNEEDSKRIESLKELCSHLSVSDQVDFELNIDFEELKSILSTASIGLHTMWNEHFGICVVEYMAAGCVVLAHNSGGPKMDIVTDVKGRSTGFLADTVDGYAERFGEIFKLSEEEVFDIQTAAREKVDEFSEDVFDENFLNCIKPLVS